VNELALGMQVVECVEEMLQAAFEQRLGEASCRVPLEQVFPAIPHRLLDKALMVTAGVVDSKHAQGRSHMPVSGVGRIRLVDELVGPELALASVSMVSGEDLESNIVVLPSPLCYYT
jgi:hypothetical protein